MSSTEKKKRITFTLNPSLIEDLKNISEKTMIPQARLVEKAIEQIVAEYEPKR